MLQMKHLLSLLLTAMLVFLVPFSALAEETLLRLTMMAAGESDCMLLESGGEAMLVDGGSDKYRGRLLELLESRGLKRLKYLYNSHPHDDHIDGLYRAMQRGITAEAFLTPFGPGLPSELHSRTLKTAKRRLIPVKVLENGESFSLGSASLTLLRWTEGSTLNDQSGMLRVEVGETALLLCADVTGQAQKALLRQLSPELLRAEVVKAPHHGLTPFVSEFLDAVAPELILATNVPRRAPKLAAQAKHRQLPLYFCGDKTLVLETDGVNWTIREEKP